LTKLDAWIAAQPEPRPSRPEAIRRVLSQALGNLAGARSIAAEDLNASSNDEPLNPEQVKAARQLLGWSQSDLAGHVGVSTKTVWVFEAGKPKPSVLNLDLVREALESAGVIFVEENGEGPGVRLRKLKAKEEGNGR